MVNPQFLNARENSTLNVCADIKSKVFNIICFNLMVFVQWRHYLKLQTTSTGSIQVWIVQVWM